MNGREEPDLPLAQPLTPREQEILICLGDGMSNRQIAEHMTVALNTVKWYVRQIFGKLGVGSRRDAVSRARRLGLLPAAGQEISVRHNIPAAITPFVGRKKELIALAKLIADPQVRIITIAGPGGIGKTRLSLEAAAKEILPGQQFPDGVFFISLAPIHSADDVITVLAAALDFHFHFASPIPRTEARQILDYLQHKKMLLIMDNFEHVLESRSFL
jgi:DNA-binding CsgD family transcriptional regulator